MILRGKSVAVLALLAIPALLVVLFFYGTPVSHLRGLLKMGLIWLFVFVELLAIVGAALFLFPSSKRRREEISLVCSRTRKGVISSIITAILCLFRKVAASVVGEPATICITCFSDLYRYRK